MPAWEGSGGALGTGVRSLVARVSRSPMKAVLFSGGSAWSGLVRAKRFCRNSGGSSSAARAARLLQRRGSPPFRGKSSPRIRPAVRRRQARRFSAEARIPRRRIQRRRESQSWRATTARARSATGDRRRGVLMKSTIALPTPPTLPGKPLGAIREIRQSRGFVLPEKQPSDPDAGRPPPAVRHASSSASSTFPKLRRRRRMEKKNGALFRRESQLPQVCPKRRNFQ